MSEWPVAPWNNPSFGTLEMELKEMETIPHAVVEIGSFINTIRKCHRGALAMGTSCAKPGKRARNPVKARSRERGSINQQEMALWVWAESKGQQNQCFFGFSRLRFHYGTRNTCSITPIRRSFTRETKEKKRERRRQTTRFFSPVDVVRSESTNRHGFDGRMDWSVDGSMECSLIDWPKRCGQVGDAQRHDVPAGREGELPGPRRRRRPAADHGRRTGALGALHPPPDLAHPRQGHAPQALVPPPVQRFRHPFLFPPPVVPFLSLTSVLSGLSVSTISAKSRSLFQFVKE